MTETIDRPLAEMSVPRADDPRLRAWIAFLRAYAKVTRRLDAELHAARDLGLAEYDALVHLALADGRRLRMSELAERVVLSRSGVSRLVDRL
jgi:DNA-binding MarR family transcriptional regulator